MIADLIRNILSILPTWLAGGFVLGACFIFVSFIIILAWMLIRRILHIRWVAPIQHKIQIRNQGNVVSLFHLFASAPEKDISFEYWLAGAQLPLTVLPPAPIQKPAPQQVIEETQPVIASTGAPSQVAGQPADAEPQSKSSGNMKEGAAKAAKKAKGQSKRALGLGRLVGGMMGTLGTLLPGDLGASLKASSVTMQSKVQTTGQAIEQPEQTMRSVDHLKGQAGSLGSSVTGSKASAKPPAAAKNQPAGQPVSAAITTQPAAAAEIQAQTAPAIPAPSLTSYVETSPLMPGDSIELELLIFPNNPYATAGYTYWLHTHQTLESTASDEAISGSNTPHPGGPDALPKKIVHNFHHKGISHVYGVLTSLLVLLVGLLGLALSISTVRWLLTLAPA